MNHKEIVKMKLHDGHRKEECQMELIKYRALLGCIQHHSITRAAKELGYTQSAVSRMILELERELDIPLLLRSKQGVIPTPQALELVPQFEQILQEEAALHQKVQVLKGNLPHHLCVGVFESITTQVLPEILQAFQRRYPGTRVQLRTGEYGEIEKWIISGEVDCGFLPQPVHKTLAAVPVVADQLVAVLPTDHPRVDEPVYQTEWLAGETVINLREYADSEMHDFWQSICPPQFSYEATDDYTILAMIERGLGMSVLHELIVDTDRFRVVKKPLDVSRVRQLCLAYPGGETVLPATKAFVSSVKAWRDGKGN